MVWAKRATRPGFSGVKSASPVSGSTSVMDEGASARVPTASSWPSCPTNRMSKPRSAAFLTS